MDCNQDISDREEWPLPSSLVPESRRVTQITGFAPESRILADVQARKKINVRHAPPKEIPTRLCKEFLSGKKNAAACLNEVCQCQDWNYSFTETTPSRAFGQYGSRLFAMVAVVNGIEYQPGEAKTKKEAKTEAARNALIEILSVNEDELLGRGPKYQHDTYGRAVPMARSSAITSSAPESYLPLPAPVVPQKSNFLPAPSSTLIDHLGKMRIAPRIFDSVGTLAEKKMREIFSKSPAIAQSCLQSAVAMFIVKKDQYGEVVALGSGDFCYRGNERHNSGNVLFDCHAETIARRAFRKYLIQQMKHWYEGNREQSIFEKAEDSRKFCLKHSVTIHLYLSKPPKGIARSSMPVISPMTATSSQLVNDLSLVALFNGGDVEERLSSNKLPSVVPMACMSGSDKILKWTVCGLQGAVLSNFVAPIYLNSITLGCDMDSAVSCKPLEYAVVKRIDPDLTTKLPDVYIVNPVKIDRYIINFPKVNENPCSISHASANWIRGERGLEVVDANTGVVDSVSQVEGPFSRLSKAAFFHSCIKLDSYCQCGFETSNYHSAKKFDENYKITRSMLISYLGGQGYGQWLTRERVVNLFKS